MTNAEGGQEQGHPWEGSEKESNLFLGKTLTDDNGTKKYM